MSTKIRNDLNQYDKYAKGWWNPDEKFYALKHLNTPRFAYFEEFISNWQGLETLDLGCGGGFTSEHLAQLGASVTGIDQSQGLINAAREHAKTQGLNIDYHHGEGERLPYPDAAFDTVVCVDVLEHVSDVSQVLSEISRVLKPGGVFLFDTINRTFQSKVKMIWFLEYLAQEIPKGTHDWNKFIKPSELESLLKSSGFQDINFKGLDITGKDRTSGEFQTTLNNNLSVMYLGACQKY